MLVSQSYHTKCSEQTKTAGTGEVEAIGAERSVVGLRPRGGGNLWGLLRPGPRLGYGEPLPVPHDVSFSGGWQPTRVSVWVTMRVAT